MPSSWQKKSRSDGRLLRSWRSDEPKGARAFAWLVIRRLAATMIAIALLGGLAYFLVRPLWTERTYLVFMATDQVATPQVPATKFAYEDCAGLLDVQRVLSPLADHQTAIRFERMLDSTRVESMLDGLAAAEVGAQDTLVVYVAAHGVVHAAKQADGSQTANESTAYLACSNYDPAVDAERGLLSVDQLLEALSRIRCGTKLLALDTDRGHLPDEFTPPEQTFAAVLRETVARRADPSVWVLASHAPGEISHVAYKRRRTVFGLMFAVGLRGFADADGDRRVSVNELATYVSSNVASWVEKSTGGLATQTPELLAANSAPATHVIFASHGQTDDPLAGGVAPGVSPQVVINGIAGLIGGAVDYFDGQTVLGPMARGGSTVQPAGDEAPETTTPIDSSRNSAARRQELDKAWESTLALEQAEVPPMAYAPHLWRLHRDRLLWCEELQSSGDYPAVPTQRIDLQVLQAISDLQQTNQSLGLLQTGASQPDATASSLIGFVARRRPTVAITSEAAPTLGLRERLATGTTAADDPLTRFTRELDDWLGQTDDGDLATDGSDFDPDWNRYPELALLKQLKSDPLVSRSLCRSAVRARRAAEQLAANPLWGEGWAKELMESADAWRLEAERLMFDKASADWQRRAESNLSLAVDAYGEAKTLLRQVQRARTQLVRERFMACEYVRWAVVSSDRVVAENVRDTLTAMADLQATLAAPSPANAGVVQRQSATLQERVNVVLRDFSRPALETLATSTEGTSQWQLAVKLQTMLVPPLVRALAEQKLATNTAMDSFVPRVPSGLQPANRTPLPQPRLDLLELEVRLQYLLLNRPQPTIASGELPTAWQTMTKEQAGLADRIGTTVDEAGDLRDAALRVRKLQELRQAAYELNALQPTTVAAADCDLFGTEGPYLAELIDRAGWFDCLARARDRVLAGRANTPTAELTAVQTLARAYEGLARQVPLQPRLPALPPAQLQMQVAPSQLSLTNASDGRVELLLTSTASTQQPVWIVAQFDDQVIEVRGVNQVILNESELRREIQRSNPEERRYPYQPAASSRLQSEPTVVLSPNQTTSLTLQVRRLSDASDDERIALMAIGQQDYLRQLLDVALPKHAALRLAIRDELGQERDLVATQQMLLYPSRVQNLRFIVENLGDLPRQLSVSLLAPTRSVADVPLLLGAVPKANADAIVGALGAVPVASGALLEGLVPRAPQTVRFDFQRPENARLATPTDQGPASIDIPWGLIVRVDDPSGGQTLLRHIGFEVHRPQSYLDSSAEFDPGSNVLTVQLQAKDVDAMPDNSIAVAVTVDEQYVLPNVPWSRVATLTRDNRFRANLRIPLTGNFPTMSDGNYLTVRLAIDEYPRSFEYRVTPATELTSLRPFRDPFVKITAPADGLVVRPDGVLQAAVELNLPDTADSTARVGIDRLPYGEFNPGDSPRPIPDDRHVSLGAQMPQGEATLAILPRVSEWTFDFPLQGESGPVQILAENGAAALSDDVEVLVDGRAPDVSPNLLFTPRDGKLLISLNPTDESRITKVGALIAGQMKEEQPGELVDQASGRWQIELDVSKLPAGTHQIALTATDEVGNTSQPKFEPYTHKVADNNRNNGGNAMVSPPPPIVAVKNRLSGSVSYGTVEIREMKVTLAGPGAPAAPLQTSSNRFDFGAVAPGKYSVTVEALAAGNWRKKTQEVEVSDQANNPAFISIAF